MAIICIYSIVDHPSTKEKNQKNNISENYDVHIIAFSPLEKRKKRNCICGSF